VSLLPDPASMLRREKPVPPAASAVGAGPPLPASLGEDVLAAAARKSPGDEDLLCDVIERDGAELAARGHVATLDRYLRAIPGLAGSAPALDAAIDVALHALRRTGLSYDDATAVLCNRHPALADAVRVAAFLDEALDLTESRTGTAERPTPRLPTAIGPVWRAGERRYELRELLGRGSQGSVYRAVDRCVSAAERPAWTAVKVLHPDAEAEEQLAPDRSEAVRARQITHPGVVRVLDRGESELGLFIVFEMVEGRTLVQHIAERGGRAGEREAVRICREVCEGLAAAHAAGVVHRDLKPANVLIDREGTCRITDFGIGVGPAELFCPTAKGRGALAFIAPEQYRAEAGAGDPAVDVYAAGALLFWMLTGEFPNGKDAREIDANLLESPAEWPRDPYGLLSGCDADAAAVCRRAMAPEPADRYPTIGALAADLERLENHEPLPWRRPGISRRLRLASRRSPAAFWACAVAACVMVTAPMVAAWAVVENQQDKAERRIDAATRAAEHGKLMLDQARSTARAISTMFDQISKHSEPDQWLSVFAGFESMIGAEKLNLPSLQAPLTEVRIDALRETIADAEASGGSEHLQTLFFRTLLGCQLLGAGEAGEAAPILVGCRERWRTMVAPQDPWLRMVEVITAAAEVQTQPRGAEPSPSYIAARALLGNVDVSSLPAPLRKSVSDAISKGR